MKVLGMRYFDDEKVWVPNEPMPKTSDEQMVWCRNELLMRLSGKQSLKYEMTFSIISWWKKNSESLFTYHAWWHDGNHTSTNQQSEDIKEQNQMPFLFPFSI